MLAKCRLDVDKVVFSEIVAYFIILTTGATLFVAGKMLARAWWDGGQTTADAKQAPEGTSTEDRLDALTGLTAARPTPGER